MRSSRWRRAGVVGLAVSLSLTIVFGIADVVLGAFLAFPVINPFVRAPSGMVSWFVLVTVGLVAFTILTICLFLGIVVSILRDVDPASDSYALLARLERASDTVARFKPTRFVEGWLSPHERTEHKQEALRERYVMGDLTRETFEQHLEDLYQAADDHANESIDNHRE